MKITCIRSGSDGNCWVINSNDNILVVDCGVDFSTIQRSNTIKSFRSVNAVLCSHYHSDHSKSLSNFEKLGIKTITPLNTEYGDKIELEAFTILILPAVHNVKCNAFLIKEKSTNKKIFFVTDSTFIPKIADVKYDLFLCEVNYDSEIIEDKIKNEVLMNSGFVNHCSLQELEDYLTGIKNKPNQLVICHLSNSGNLDVKKAINDLSKIVGYKVKVATPKLELEV